MAYSDGVTHRRWMQVSENKRPDLRRLALHCLMKHLFPTYVRRQLFLWVDDNYFSRSATTTFC